MQSSKTISDRYYTHANLFRGSDIYNKPQVNNKQNPLCYPNTYDHFIFSFLEVGEKKGIRNLTSLEMYKEIHSLLKRIILNWHDKYIVPFRTITHSFPSFPPSSSPEKKKNKH